MSTNMEHVFRIGKQSSVLPAGYTQLEYIESTGTQYIDIPFTFNNTDEMYAEVAMTDILYTDRYFIAPTPWNTNDNRFALGGTHTNPTTGFNYSYGAALSGNTRYVSGTDNDFHIYHYINKTFSMVDLGIVKDVSDVDWGGETANLRLFYGYAYPIKCKIKNIWHKRNNKYLYNYIPAKRNSDNVLGMYDTVSGTFLTNTGSGVFTAGPAVEVCKISQSNQTIWERAILLESDKDSEVTFRSTRNDEYSPLKELNAYGELTQNGVPSSYTELEYIESTGTQYVILDEGIYLQTGSIIEVDYQITGNNTRQPDWWQNIYGNALISYPKGGVGYGITTKLNLYSYYYDSKNHVSSTVDFNRHIIRQESNKFYRDNALVYTTTESTFTNRSKIWLFSCSGATDLHMVGKMYSAKIWSNGTNLSFDGVPAKRNSDGALGMYDTVSKRFFTNAGTGVFTAGNEISTLIPPVDLVCNNGVIKWDGSKIVTEGTQEKIAVTGPNGEEQIILVSMLNRVGNYQDEQDILSGVVTRNVGIKVLDGTEVYKMGNSGAGEGSYIKSDATDVWVDIEPLRPASNMGYCSHLQLSNNPIWNTTGYPNTFVFNASLTSKQCHLNFANDVIDLDYEYAVGLPTDEERKTYAINKIKAYVAAQYAAGTPVIVVYPLATSTTESVAAQDIEINKGTYTAKVEEASLNDLDISVKYLGND